MRKHKQHILYIIIVILLSLVSVINTDNTSSLSYQSNVGVGFTFNPTLSVSLSSSDLVIANLVPGNTLDSNVINVSVATNASYGYTLSAIVNGNNSNLTHNNETNTFSSIATNANLSDLEDSEDTNIWGYSYKDNTVETPAWSNYNGLSSSNSTTLINTNSNISSNLDFKIAAKSSNTQAGGTYTGAINFTAVSNVAPMSLFDSFLASGAEMYNGYFKMQDMTHDICINVDIEESELQLIDARDNKLYWVAKLKDGNCWMTQNLDLDLSTSTILTSNDTDLNDNSLSGAYSQATGYDYDSATNTISWRPANSTNTWTNSAIYPYSKDRGKYYPEGTPENETINDYHRLNGNYYNWTAAIASNDSSTIVDDTYEDIDASPQNSVCPKGWRLPTTSNIAGYNEFGRLVSLYGNTPAKIMAKPLWFVRSGNVNNGNISNSGSCGFYWYNTAVSSTNAHDLNFCGSTINPAYSNLRSHGFSVRCLAH